MLISRVANDPARADEIMLDELRAGTGEVSRWPTDGELGDYYESHDAYNNIAKPRLVMALAAVEQSLYSNKTDLLTIPTNLTLEHVIPQKWQEHWPLPEGLSAEDEETAREARLRSIHRLGNLTLTAGPLNTALSNSAWADKQRALNAESRLLLNSRLVENYGDRFDETAVADRTRVLVERICAGASGRGHAASRARLTRRCLRERLSSPRSASSSSARRWRATPSSRTAIVRTAPMHAANSTEPQLRGTPATNSRRPRWSGHTPAAGNSTPNRYVPKITDSQGIKSM